MDIKQAAQTVADYRKAYSIPTEDVAATIAAHQAIANAFAPGKLHVYSKSEAGFPMDAPRARKVGSKATRPAKLKLAKTEDEIRKLVLNPAEKHEHTRYAFAGIYHGAEESVATDGRRLHVIRQPLQPADGCIYETGKRGEVLDRVEGKFPPYRDVCPDDAEAMISRTWDVREAYEIFAAFARLDMAVSLYDLDATESLPSMHGFTVYGSSWTSRAEGDIRATYGGECQQVDISTRAYHVADALSAAFAMGNAAVTFRYFRCNRPLTIKSADNSFIAAIMPIIRPDNA